MPILLSKVLYITPLICSVRGPGSITFGSDYHAKSSMHVLVEFPFE